MEQWVALMPHSEKVLGSIPGLLAFYVEFAWSPPDYVGSLRVLWLPPTSKVMHKRDRLIGT